MDNPVAIISCDRFHGFVLGRFIAAEFPGCTVKVYHSALRALAALEVESFSYSFMDPQMPDLDGLDYIPELINSGKSERNLIVSNRTDERTLNVLGAQNYDGWFDTGSCLPGDLQVALTEISFGRKYLSPALGIAMKSINGSTNLVLSGHEEKILSLLGSGLDNVAAAERLQLAVDTVRSHRARIMLKLHLHHKGDLMNYALARGYVRHSCDGIPSPRMVGLIR